MHAARRSCTRCDGFSSDASCKGREQLADGQRNQNRDVMHNMCRRTFLWALDEQRLGRSGQKKEKSESSHRILSCYKAASPRHDNDL